MSGCLRMCSAACVSVYVISATSSRVFSWGPCWFSWRVWNPACLWSPPLARPSLPPSVSPFLHKSDESTYSPGPLNRPLALSQEKIKSKHSAQDDARVRSGGRGEAGAFLWRRGRHAMPRSWPPGSSRRQTPPLPHGSHAALQSFTASSFYLTGISNSNWKDWLHVCTWIKFVLELSLLCKHVAKTIEYNYNSNYKLKCILKSITKSIHLQGKLCNNVNM